MRKGLMIIGIIILLVGFFLATISPWTSMEELKDDYDFENYSFRSYDPGDRVTIRGEITSENEYDYQGKKHYVYRLDDVEFGFLASDRVGDEGEVIIIECEVIELKIQNGSNVTTRETLEARNDVSNPNTFGIFFIILGIIFIIISVLIKPKEKPTEPSPKVKDAPSMSDVPPPPPPPPPP